MNERCTCGERLKPPRKWPPVLVQCIGLVALLAAVNAKYDGWAAVGAFGLALVVGTMDGVAHAAADALRR